MNKKIIFYFLFYLFAIINCQKEKIGYLYNSSDTTSTFYEQYFNDIIELLEYENIMEIKLYPFNNDIETVLSTIESDEIKHVFTDESTYEYIENFKDKSYYTWMAYPFAKEHCTKNIVYYSSIVPVMMNCIYYFIY